MTTPDSRFGVDYLSQLRNLELAGVYRSVVTDPNYLALDLKDDGITQLVLDDAFWEGLFEKCPIFRPSPYAWRALA